MALTQEMMDRLIAEYFNDPKDLGYRKYGRLNGNKFYIPQIVALVNSSRDREVRVCLHEDPIECSAFPDLHGVVIKREFYPPRICEIFAGIENAPNRVTAQDLQDTFMYFLSTNPQGAEGLTIVKE